MSARTAHQLPIVTPAFDQESVNVVFATDQNYLPYLAVCLSSLIDHASPTTNYDVCILTGEELDLCSFPLDKFRQKNISLRFITIDLSHYPYDFSKHLSGHYTIATYYRFFIGEIFSRYRRVLYLDTDIIILDDIAKLYHFKLEGKMFAAGTDRCHFLPLDQNEKQYITQTLAVPFLQYFCAGVMLMDITKMKAARLLHQALSKLDELGHPHLVDQDVLNALYADQTVLLPVSWNFMWSVILTGSAQAAATYRQAAEPIHLIHYDSAIKPWNSPDKPLADRWWQYFDYSRNFIATTN